MQKPQMPPNQIVGKGTSTPADVIIWSLLTLLYVIIITWLSM